MPPKRALLPPLGPNPRCPPPLGGQVYGPQTVVDHLTLKGVWPTSPRDFLSTVHWRLVAPHTLALVAVACPPQALSPAVRAAYPLSNAAAAEAKGVVRGEVLLAGWRLREVGGTRARSLLGQTRAPSSTPISTSTP